MRGVILATLFVSFTIYGSCNHTIVDKDPRFACVTVKNESQKNIAVSSENGGFNIPPGLSEESMLCGNYLQISPNPFYPGNDLRVGCNFEISDARNNKIIVTFAEGDIFLVAPTAFGDNCKLF